MAFQITELALDAEAKMTGRKIIPYPYQTRQEAVDTIETVASRYVKSGYDREQRSWWAIAENGNQKRFVVEEIWVCREAGLPDVSGVGHYGTGDLEITLTRTEDLERAKPLIQRSYDEAWLTPWPQKKSRSRPDVRAGISSPVTFSPAHPLNRLIAQLNENWRVVVDPLQWILQQRKGNPRKKNPGWWDRSFCRTREGLLRCVRDYCGEIDAAALAKLDALPDHYEDWRAIQNLDVRGTDQDPDLYVTRCHSHVFGT